MPRKAGKATIKRRRKRREELMRRENAMMTVPEFCWNNGGISISTYYRLKQAGKGPRETLVGKRVFITPEAEAEWRKARSGS